MNTSDKVPNETLFQKRHHVLIVGGGSDLIPRLRAVDTNVQTSVICRPSVLKFVYEIEKNNKVLVIEEKADTQAWVEHAGALHKIDPFDSVVSFAEIDQDKAAAISESLGLDYHSSSTIEWVHNKLQMREQLRSTGVEDIPNALVMSAEEVIRFGKKWGYPLIIKPCKGRASAGVSVVYGPEDVAIKFERSNTATAPRLEPSPLIVERYLQGREYSVEAISEGGQHVILSIVEKYKEEVSKVEIGHMIPAILDSNTYTEIENHIIKVLDALNIRFGITHTEIMLTEEGPRVIETHVRAAGDDIPYLLQDSLGLDPLQYVVEQAAGESIYERLKRDVERAKRTQKGVAIWFVHTNLEGELLNVENTEQVSQAEGVVEFIPSFELGMTLEGLKNSYSRLASIRTVAETPIKALELAKAAADQLKLQVKVNCNVGS